MKGKRAPNQFETRPAALVYLSHALDDLSLLIFAAEDWVRSSTLLEFTDDVEKQVRTLKALIDDYVEHSKDIRPGGDSDIEFVVTTSVAGVQKALNSIAALRNRAMPDFSAEAEELRKLRSGELKP